MSGRLGTKDWIDAGLLALAEHGVEAVRVERLAKALGVTKGGFYWHFRDRGDLLDALLEAWKARATGDIIRAIEEYGGDARARLCRLMAFTIQLDGRLARAIRDWASRDEVARTAQQQIDGLRLDYLETLFTGMNFTPAEAKARAALLYNALIGAYAMAGAEKSRASLHEHLDIILAIVVRAA